MLESGSFRLFRVFGVTVFLHWSWFVVAYLLYVYRTLHPNPVVHIVIYVGLFGIVLLHEFGHALACRSVGGRAERILLFPLGGVATVQPPARPGPMLWSLAAGPLVNVALFPVLWAAAFAIGGLPAEGGGLRELGDLQAIGFALAAVNTGLLLFNLLPIYPLDGGQMLQSVLWFFLGRTRSLRIVAGIGLAAAGLFGLWALTVGDLWLLLIMVFVGWQAYQGIILARRVEQAERLGMRVPMWDENR